MAIRNLARLLILIILTGCVPVKETFYLPRLEENRNEGTVCGSVPYGGFYSKVTPHFGLSIISRPIDGDLVISLQFILDTGHTLKFTENYLNVTFDNITKETEFWSSSNRYQAKMLDLTTPMVGAFPEILVAVLIVDDFEGESFTLEFPTLEVDSTPVVIPSIEFDRTVKHGIMACIQ